MYLLSLFIFSGVYGDAVTLEYLKDFHRRRVQILAESGADLIAFETIPNKLEAKVFAWFAILLVDMHNLSKLQHLPDTSN